MDSKQKSELIWQKRMLPFLIGTIVILAFFFFIISVIQLNKLQTKIENKPSLNLEEVIKKMDINKSDLEKKWQLLANLELFSIQNRYHQANILTMSRIWLIYLGFITGMVLSFMGAVFIIGKITVDPIEIEASDKHRNYMLKTTSPGLVLAVLGTALMVITLVSKSKIEVNDASIYMPLVYERNNDLLQQYKNLKDTVNTTNDAEKLDKKYNINEVTEADIINKKKKQKKDQKPK